MVIHLFMYFLQVGCGQLPFIRTDDYPTYPDIVFRVEGYNFLCHKVFLQSDFGRP